MTSSAEGFSEADRSAFTSAAPPVTAISVANRELPPVPEGLKPDDVTLVLFYQYIEPAWSKRAHKKAVATVLELCKKNGVNGRGRCAPEGLNCTLTGTALGVRSFCADLRAWEPTFNNTDFKLTDGVAHGQRFKSLSIRKTNELVAYGLGGQKAPELKTWAGEHLRADEYHAMLADKQKPTVVIDVRNQYESTIGHFNPPEGGAELVDPKMRNSRDFAPWLALPETQEKLNGKRVMMYCTGGIRCERATALLNQLTATTPGFETAGVYELRGGVERYMKTYPGGGFWKGKNYVFDRRRAQVPSEKPAAALVADVESKCVVCRAPEDVYRGKYKCQVSRLGIVCAVPVIVCAACRLGPASMCGKLQCELCRQKYAAPTILPDFSSLGQKLKKRPRGPLDAALDGLSGGGDGNESPSKKKKKKKKKEKKKAPGGAEEDDAAATVETSTSRGKRLFVGKLPLLLSVADLRTALGDEVRTVQWLTDRTSGHFYGSAFVEMATESACDALIARKKATKLGSKKIKMTRAPMREGEVWPPVGFEQRERPPIVL